MITINKFYEFVKKETGRKAFKLEFYTIFYPSRKTIAALKCKAYQDRCSGNFHLQYNHMKSISEKYSIPMSKIIEFVESKLNVEKLDLDLKKSRIKKENIKKVIV